MRKRLWSFLNLVIVQCFVVSAYTRKAMEEEIKADAAITVRNPPEGNTTFLGGTTWCVARPGVSQADLKIALDWACGLGKADCRAIQPGGPCFRPDTLLSHASYAFNSYYQQNGNSDIACYFGGTAALTSINPSYGRCIFASTRSMNIRASSGSSNKFSAKNIWWRIDVLILFLYLSRR